MAVVNKRSATLPDLTAASPGQAPARIDHGTVRVSRHQADIANGDSATSTFEVARLPSRATILPQSTLFTTGVGGLTDVDVGFAGDPDALVDGANLTSAGTVTRLNGAVALGDDKKMVWELAGLTKDPKEDISVFITLKTNASAAGTLVPVFFYSVD